MEGTRGWRHREGDSICGSRQAREREWRWREAGGATAVEERKERERARGVGAEDFPQTLILLQPPLFHRAARDPLTVRGKDRHALERVMWGERPQSRDFCPELP